MIVVDTRVIAYLLLDGEKTSQARRTFQKDPLWAAPLLWRSEFRSILSAYLRKGSLEFADALQLMRTAETLLQNAEYSVRL